jgi:phosphatidylinositol glycan class Q protein
MSLSGILCCYDSGKKWNVLRNRIDSYEYKVDQLLLGTLLFTVLLFLLPTVAMYYLVFSLLRTSVLAVHVMINISINLLARIPIYGLLIWLFDPLQLPGGIKLNLKTHLQSCPQGFSITLQSEPCSWSSLWKCSGPTTLTNQSNFKHILVLLLQGQLIYPWSWK